MAERQLTPLEKRLIVGALRMAATETETTIRRINGTKNAVEMRELARQQRKLADELDDHLVHISVRCNRMAAPVE